MHSYYRFLLSTPAESLAKVNAAVYTTSKFSYSRPSRPIVNAATENGILNEISTEFSRNFPLKIDPAPAVDPLSYLGHYLEEDVVPQD